MVEVQKEVEKIDTAPPLELKMKFSSAKIPVAVMTTSKLLTGLLKVNVSDQGLDAPTSREFGLVLFPAHPPRLPG